jgi:hypothetical protein
MDEIQCEDLLTEAEVEQVLNFDVTPIGRKASSCYWSVDTGLIQLVFNTGAGFAAWKRELLRSFTEKIDIAGFEVWAEPATGSVTAFGLDRGLIIHGVHSQKDAVTLISLAFVRLTR